MRSTVLGFALAVTFGVFAACGGSDDPQPHGHAGGSSGSSGADSGSNCEGRGESFSAGMTKQSGDGTVSVELMRSDVVPPGQDVNTWTLRIEDASGQAVAGAAVKASFHMPDHTHPAQTSDGTESEAGTYEVKPDFSMPGLWEITVTVTPAGGSASSVLFSFCIAPD